MWNIIVFFKYREKEGPFRDVLCCITNSGRGYILNYRTPDLPIDNHFVRKFKNPHHQEEPLPLHYY